MVVIARRPDCAAYRVRVLNTSEREALECIDTEATVNLLLDLLRIPSIGGSDAEIEIQQVLAERMAALDLDVDLWSMDLNELAERPDFPGVEVDRREAWGLVASSNPGEVPALVLQAHADVVPPGDETRWAGAPFIPRITGMGADRLIIARGACDMKAGMVANIAALQAIRASGIDLPSGIALHSVIGEEDGGLGAFGTLARGYRGHACIITEPTDGTIITANAGSLTFRIEVSGLGTHGSAPYAGSSALDSYLVIHSALARLQDKRNQLVEPLMTEYPVPYPLSVGHVQAGDWASSVPDLLVADGRYGLRIDEDPHTAQVEFEQAVAEAAADDHWLRDHPPVVSWPGGQFRGGSLPFHHPLLEVVGRAHADATGQPPPLERGAPYGSDLRLYAAAGIPTLHYGPGNIHRAHGADESVSVTELITVTQALTLTILRSCRVG